MTTTPLAMAEALGRLWTKFLPEIENRLAILQTAADGLTSGQLSEDERQAGHQAAHKLAGVLGTFGLHRGTDLARHIELLLSDETSAFPANQLTTWVEELKTLVGSRK